MFGELGFGEIILLLSTLGAGGVLNEVVRRWFSRNKQAAETEAIEARTSQSISQIIEQKTERLVHDYEAAIERIGKLEKRVQELKLELDSNRQIMRIKSLEADVRFYKSRVEVLEAQNLSLIDGMKAYENNTEV